LFSITPIRVGQIRVFKAGLTFGVDYDVRFWAPVFVFLVKETDSNSRSILVDAGFNPSRRSVDPVRGGIRMFKAGLRNARVDIERVSTLVLTHLHNDHSSFVRLFPNAKVFVQDTELAFARNPLPTQAMYYDARVLDCLESANLQKVRGDKRIDDGLRLIQTPGHTPGSQSVLVDTQEGVYAITGDTVPMYHNWFPRDPEYGTPCSMSRIPPGINTSVEDWFESAGKIAKVTNLIVPSHDPLVRNLKVIP
jgi:N-acyl homoserine lactone hydrolase